MSSCQRTLFLEYSNIQGLSFSHVAVRHFKQLFDSHCHFVNKETTKILQAQQKQVSVLWPTLQSILSHSATGREVFDWILDQGYYSERDTSNVVRQVLEAVAYLHSLHIVHRNLKVTWRHTLYHGMALYITIYIYQEKMANRSCSSCYISLNHCGSYELKLIMLNYQKSWSNLFQYSNLWRVCLTLLSACCLMVCVLFATKPPSMNISCHFP